MVVQRVFPVSAASQLPSDPNNSSYAKVTYFGGGVF